MAWILLTNDDGIEADSLQILYFFMKEDTVALFSHRVKTILQST